MAVTGKDISFTYELTDSGKPALDNISFGIKKGEFLAIIGANGCGKSTLAKHLNAILVLQEGTLSVLNIDVSDQGKLWELRRLCGMVFQNPDNQFVSSIVEEDVAFGLRNFDTPEHQIPSKTEAALKTVGMQDFSRRSPHTLSGGQKQRVALAGVLAIEPEIIIFDEATAMLDPIGRKEVFNCLKKLNSIGKTIIMITHYAEEATYADRVMLMKEGKIVKTGAPREILTNKELMLSAGLTVPFAPQIYYDLKKEGIMLNKCPLTNDELVEELCALN